MSTDPRNLSVVKLALLADRMQERNGEVQLLASEPIAIVGMACRLPGGVATPAALWDLLVLGGDVIGEVPAERWDAAACFDPDPAAPGKINTTRGGFLSDVERFDPLFFGIAPREAIYIDPQQRLLLEVAWEAFDDAGRPLDGLRGSRTGVFVGLCGSDYSRMLFDVPGAISAHTLSGTASGIASGRLSYLFDLRGPSIVIDTACSSSLVAVHAAAQSLRARESDLAVAGGVSLKLTPNETIALAKWGMLAPDGRCKTFDASANGFVRSEGCGLVVLKRLADALRDGDRVQAVIRGSAVNQDGRSNVLTAPNGEAQRDVIRAALRRASLEPEDVTYVETHGTGTRVGDPIEVEALAEVLGRPRPSGGACYLGAIKANVGHLEAAAGVAGLIKAVLCLDRGAIPPQIHFTRPNPLLPLEGTCLRIPTELTPWETGAAPRRAGVSSFGFSGTNAHVVVEQAPRIALPARSARRAQLLPLSARSESALAAAADACRLLFARPDAPALDDVCYTAAVRRRHHALRTAVVAADSHEAVEALGALRRRPAPPGVPRVAFVFSGQGSTAAGMAAGLLRDEPVFAEAIARCDEALGRLTTHSVARLLTDSSDTSWMDDTERCQIVLFAAQVGIAALWRAWGVEPGAVAGHSLGEIAAAHVAGALDLETAVGLVVRRAALMKHRAPVGGMAVVSLAPEAAERLLERWRGRLVIAAHNGPESVTLSGEPQAIDELLAAMTPDGTFARRLTVDRAFHSPHMEAAASELAASLGSLVCTGEARATFYSTVIGTRVEPDALTAEYWCRNIRERVRFLEAVEAMLADGYDTFIEIGPHPTLLPGVEAAARDRTIQMRPSLRRGHDDRTFMLGSLASLYERGLDVNWVRVADADGRLVSIPPYAWDRDRYWFEPAAAGTDAVAAAPGAETLLGRRIESPFITGALFETTLDERSPAWLGEHRLAGTVVVPAAALIDMALGAVCAALGVDEVDLRDGVIHRALTLPEGTRRQVQVAVEGGLSDGRVRIASRVAGPSTPWETIFECRLAADAPPAEGEGQAIVDAPPSSPFDEDAMYERMAARGVSFGPAFRAIAGLHRDARGVVVTLEPPAVPERGSRLDPPRLDACLQGLEAFYSESREAWLPVGFRRVVLMRRGAIAGGYLRVQDAAATPPAELRAALTLFDETSAPVVVLEGFRMRAVAADRVDWVVTGTAPALLHETHWSSAVPASGEARRGPWLILADNGGVGERFAAALTARGVECTLVHTGPAHGPVAGRPSVDLSDPALWTQLLRDEEVRRCRTVVCLWPLDGSSGAVDALDAQSRICRPVFGLLQAIGGAPIDELWLATRGAQRCPDAAAALQAPLWGLASVVPHEFPQLRCRIIDLDASDSPEAQGAALVAEAADDAAETRVAWSGGRRFAARLRAAPEPSGVRRPADWRLPAPSTGLLEDLTSEPATLSGPGPGQVAVEPEAIGLNFRDVLNALGMLGELTAPLGAECAGRVVAVGQGVDPAVLGQRVMAFAVGAFASRVVLHADLTAPVPDGLTPVEAASIPVAFLTAKYGLERLARVQPGDCVLVHAAAGGVGLAAIQIARAAGAVVFATAGSNAKRDYLRAIGVEHVFSSRDTSFADLVLRATDGAGVNVVVNSLADEFVAASVKALARGGRFVELGKRGVWSAERMAETRPDVAFLPFDLSIVAAATPALIRELFEEILADFAAGRCGVLPIRSYQLGECRTAFEHMAHARHTGKIVVHVPQSPPAIRSDATYLVAGATAGLASVLLDQLFERGARHFALLARRAPGAEHQRTAAALAARGAQVRWLQADVAREDSLRAALAAVEDAMPAIRGVFHLAGVIDDAPIATLSWERCVEVMAPKIQGAWNLHTLTRGLPLDHFVLYSSVAALVGWRGQSAYAAGNAYLDALAQWRASLGLPGITVNWGPWQDAGMAAGVMADRGVDFASRGLPLIGREDAARALTYVLCSDAPQVVVARIDGRRLPPGSLTTSGAGGANDAPGCAGTSVSLREDLAAAAPGRRQELLMSALEGEAAVVLGLKAGFRFDRRRPLHALGLDSLLAVQMANSLGVRLQLPLSPTLLFDYPTLDALALHLDSLLRPAPSSPAGGATAADPIEGLSDDEAEALLAEELDRLGDGYGLR